MWLPVGDDFRTRMKPTPGRPIGPDRSIDGNDDPVRKRFRGDLIEKDYPRSGLAMSMNAHSWYVIDRGIGAR